MNVGYRQRQAPFPPLRLSFEDQQQYRELTLGLLNRTLRSYEEQNAGFRSPPHHSQLDNNARWKRLKTRSNVSIYSERGHQTSRDFPRVGDNWVRPSILLAVGTIQSTLEEVMFGVVTPDIGAFNLKAATLLSQNSDGVTLAQIASPTEQDPFQNLRIQWMVEDLPMPMKLMTLRRDYTMLSASGITTLEGGERIGYDLVQPLPLPECPPQPKLMIRGKLMYGALYRETEDGTVDVFVQVCYENRGRLLNKLVMNAMGYSMLGFWDSPRLAELKKLAWCLANRENLSNRSRRRRMANALRQCERCLQPLSRALSGTPSHKNSCVLCGVLLCSSCRVKVPGNSGKSGAKRDVPFVLCRP